MTRNSHASHRCCAVFGRPKHCRASFVGKQYPLGRTELALPVSMKELATLLRTWDTQLRSSGIARHRRRRERHMVQMRVAKISVDD